MRHIALAILITLASSLGAFAQSSNTCFDTKFTTTGRQQLKVPGGVTGTADRFSSGTFAYLLSGSPSGVSIKIEAADAPLPTTPATVINAVTTTTNATAIPIGQLNQVWRYYYGNLATFSGGTAPTLTLTACLSPEAVPGGVAADVPWSGILPPTANLNLNFAGHSTTFTNAGTFSYAGKMDIGDYVEAHKDLLADQGANGDDAVAAQAIMGATTGNLFAGYNSGMGTQEFFVDVTGKSFFRNAMKLHNISVPSTPGAGDVTVYPDSTAKRLHDINSDGVVATTVVPDTGASNNFLTAIATTGAISKAQPSFSNLSGTATIAQLPAGAVPMYGITGSALTGAHAVSATCTLGTSCAVTLSGSAVFTSATSYSCFANDTTVAANAVVITKASGTSVTFTGTGIDALSFVCAGN